MSVGLCLKAANLPGPEYSLTNRIYASPVDYAQLVPPGSSDATSYLEVKGLVVLALERHQHVEPGTIALSKLHREFAKIGLAAEVSVQAVKPPPRSELGVIRLEVDSYLKKSREPRLEVDGESLEQNFKEKFMNQMFMPGQSLVLDHEGRYLRLVVTAVSPVDLGVGNETSVAPDANLRLGMVVAQTEVEFARGPTGKIRVHKKNGERRSIFRPDFNFGDLGIGGLSKEFGDIFRRAFASRIFPPHVVQDLGIKHTRGILLYGPPGTGKTLLARQIAKFLKAREPKIINGPEVLNRYVGQSEHNIRKLFQDAETEYELDGEDSQLHIIIFDEIDAICKARGTRGDSTGVSDSIVNQLLSKIDGVNALNNILLIGMTNRLDMLDEALLRPGRLEVHVEISLPNEAGRVEILNIHTKKMREKNYLAPDVSIPELAAKTKNISGAEIEGLVRSATSFAFNRKVDINKQLQNPASSEKDPLRDLMLRPEDFDRALDEVKPAFGVHDDEFENRLRYGVTEYSADFTRLLTTCRELVAQVRDSSNTQVLSVLLEGQKGAGKTALAALLAKESGFPLVRMVASEDFLGYSEAAKVAAIAKIFSDAYKSSLSIVVLDNLERLLGYVRIGPRFSNAMLQALHAIMRREPPHDRRILVIGTTSSKDFLDEAPSKLHLSWLCSGL